MPPIKYRPTANFIPITKEELPQSIIKIQKYIKFLEILYLSQKEWRVKKAWRVEKKANVF